MIKVFNYKKDRDMKQQICLIVIFMSMLSFVKGQQDVMKREYEYDAAGNRVVRKVLEMQSSSSSSPSKQKSMEDEDETDKTDEADKGDKTDKADKAGETGVTNANSAEERFFVDNAGDIKLKVFPNPTTSVITLLIEDMQDEVEGTVTLYNLSGAKIGEQRITSYRTEIDMSSYPAASYLATVRINGKACYWKIVKN